jgi:competence ComEA-like helix-hairpin-helix protein
MQKDRTFAFFVLFAFFASLCVQVEEVLMEICHGGSAFALSECMCDGGAIMNRACATVIVWLVISLTLVGITPPIAASTSQSQNEESVNINTASAEELERLPGIGPALASRILEHRQKHGPFKRPQDIVIVRGMSAKLYRRIARLIRI